METVMVENNILNSPESGIELSDELLDGVAGGYVFFNGDGYEVIDEKGNVVKTYWGTKIDDHRRAKNHALELGLSDRDIIWYELDALRQGSH